MEFRHSTFGGCCWRWVSTIACLCIILYTCLHVNLTVFTSDLDSTSQGH